MEFEEFLMDCYRIKYPSKKHADKKLKKLRKNFLMPENAYAYKCPNCEGWHLGLDKFKFHNKK